MANPILLDIPESFETERLLIRVPRAGDGPELNAAVLETFEGLQPWMPWAKERPSVEKSEENSRRAYSFPVARGHHAAASHQVVGILLNMNEPVKSTRVNRGFDLRAPYSAFGGKSLYSYAGVPHASS